MAQLPSRVPVGLQGGRIGELPAEREHGVHRHVRATRPGIQSENGEPRHGGETGPEDRRRCQKAS